MVGKRAPLTKYAIALFGEHKGHLLLLYHERKPITMKKAKIIAIYPSTQLCMETSTTLGSCSISVFYVLQFSFHATNLIYMCVCLIIHI